ncbi:hypothetical protein KP509_1Z065000 [Ceratopteris richardii]|nr:hypothetical protein KP509_1Z065000 [Ceratopteris richardii]
MPIEKGEREREREREREIHCTKGALKAPVERITSFLKSSSYAKCVGASASVYLTIVLEYLVVEVLELASNSMQDNKKNHIVHRHIQLTDEKLSKLLGHITIANPGILPNIHTILLRTKTSTLGSKESTKV